MRRHSTPSPRATADPTVFAQIRNTEAFAELRAARRGPLLALTATVVGLYLLTGLLANEAPTVMAFPVVGPMNAGLALGLLQCGATVGVSWWYAWYAGTVLDPLREPLRAFFEQPGRQW